MPSEYSIQTILSIADISQYLANADNDKQTFFKGGTLDPLLGRTIYRIRRSLGLRFQAAPNDTTLRGTAEYLLSLCGPYALQAKQILNNLGQSPPVITGPNNQSVLVGQTGTFSVSVTGTAPFAYQWYLNSVLIPGATSSSYSKTNAQLTDSGGVYFVKVSNPAAPSGVFSNTATLTVTAVLQGFFAYMDTDPGPDLQANLDPFTYQSTFAITHNAPFVITLPGASTPNKYLIVKVPIGESVKSTWFNTPLNNGTIPDSVWQSLIQFGGFSYYYTRVAASMDTSQTLTLS